MMCIQFTDDDIFYTCTDDYVCTYVLMLCCTGDDVYTSDDVSDDVYTSGTHDVYTHAPTCTDMHR